MKAVEGHTGRREIYNEMKHFDSWNVRASAPVRDIIVPVGVVPADHYGLERAHYNQWNSRTGLSAYKAPKKEKRVVPQHPKLMKVDSGRRHCIVDNDPNKQFNPQRRHNRSILSQTTKDYTINFDRRNKSAPYPGKARNEFSLEAKLQKKINGYDLGAQRNYLECIAKGDKSYKYVEMSDNFYQYGSTVSGVEFGKLSGAGAGLSIPIVGKPRGRKLDKERSNRSDRFGRDQLIKLRGGQVSSSDSGSERKKKMYSELRKEAAKAAEIRSVQDLPDEVTYFDEHDEAATPEPSET